MNKNDEWRDSILEQMEKDEIASIELKFRIFMNRIKIEQMEYEHPFLTKIMCFILRRPQVTENTL